MTLTPTEKAGTAQPIDKRYNRVVQIGDVLKDIYPGIAKAAAEKKKK